VELVWKAKTSASKFLYFTNRYPLMVVGCVSTHVELTSAASYRLCKMWVPTEAYFTLLTVGSVQATLLLRVIALYGNSKYIAAGLSSLLISCFAASFTISGLLARRLTPMNVAGLMTGCLDECNGCFPLSITVHVPVVVFEIITLGMTMRKTIRFVRSSRKHATHGRMSMFELILRQGCCWFMAIFIMTLLDIIFLAFSPESMGLWFLAWMRGLLSILGSRLILNLRGQIHYREPLDLPPIPITTVAAEHIISDGVADSETIRGTSSPPRRDTDELFALRTLPGTVSPDPWLLRLNDSPSPVPGAGGGRESVTASIHRPPAPQWDDP